LTSPVSDEAPAGASPLVSVAARNSEDRSRKALAKLPIVAVPLVVWLFAWSLWALWGVFVPLLVIVLGRNPRAIWKEIAGYLQYFLRVTAYLSVTVEPFPGYRNLGHDDYPVSLELEYPERQSRWLALGRIVLNPLLAILGFAIILATAVAAVGQFFTVIRTGSIGHRLRVFQVRLLDFHGRTFAFLLTLTDQLPFGPARRHPAREAA
jgi:Domain of unknown function (DUF4389)